MRMLDARARGSLAGRFPASGACVAPADRRPVPLRAPKRHDESVGESIDERPYPGNEHSARRARRAGPQPARTVVPAHPGCSASACSSSPSRPVSTGISGPARAQRRRRRPPPCRRRRSRSPRRSSARSSNGTSIPASSRPSTMWRCGRASAATSNPFTSRTGSSSRPATCCTSSIPGPSTSPGLGPGPARERDGPATAGASAAGARREAAQERLPRRQHL